MVREYAAFLTKQLDRFTFLSASKKGLQRQWVVGVGLMLVALWLDPLVFRTKVIGVGPAILGEYLIEGYVSFSLAATALTIALWSPHIPNWIGGCIAGALALFGCLSLLIGALLLPFVILGGMFAIILLCGFRFDETALAPLGLIPLLTGIICLHQSRRLYSSCSTRTPFRAWFVTGFAGLGLVAIIAGQIGDNCFRRFVEQDPFVFPNCVRELSLTEEAVVWANQDALALAYFHEDDFDRKQALKDAFEWSTWLDMRQHLQVLLD